MGIKSETEILKDIIVKSGGNPESLPDNLKTTLLKEIARANGVDVTSLPDNLKTTLLKAIAENVGGGSGGGEDTERTVVLKETILTFFPEQSLGLYMATNVPLFELEEGETYTALWAGTEYVCTAETASLGEITAVAIGNKAMLGLGENTGEPFIIYYIPDQQVSSMLSMDTEETDRAVAIYRGQEGSESSDSELDIDQINKIIELLFDDGDMVVKAPYGQLYKTVTINKPDTLIPENIAKDVNIAGVVGTHSGGGEAVDYLAQKIEGTLSEYSNDSIENISADAFHGCTTLANVSFPACTSIGKSAFQSCSSLTSVSFPACSRIDDYAFAYCRDLTSVNLPVCTSVSNYVFLSCSSLTSVSFPACSHIGGNAFAYCINLTDVNFPACTSVLGYAFNRCSCLTSVNIPACSYIGNAAFMYCSALTSVSFPVCSYIDGNAFYSCASLTSVNFPACSCIGGSAFENCSSLTSVSFPACTSISNGAFSNCSALTSVNLPVCTNIGRNAFYKCSSLSALILGASSVCKLSLSNAFTGTPIASGTGYVYVWASLVDAYKSETNWAYFSAQISARENMPS